MIRTFSKIGAILIVALTALYFVGPRVPADTTITFNAAQISTDPAAWLAQSEATVTGIRPGLEKEIVWADPNSHDRTPLAIVYIHGFSASKGEIRPVPDRVAEVLGANLFYTRLTGHGADSAAMGTASVNDWINDYAEAIAIGHRIGEKVIVMATSTGAALATWAATQPSLSKDVAGLVLISPNYAVQAAGAQLLTMPWGGLLAQLLLGEESGGAPVNEAHARYWTTTYPTAAILPMAATAQLARDAEVETITIPVLFLFSDADKVVQPDATRQIAARWGGPVETMIVEGSDDPSNHVIAGDARSPSTTTLAAGRITEWIRSLAR